MFLPLLLLLQSASALRVSNGADANLDNTGQWPAAGGKPSHLQLMFNPPLQQRRQQDDKGNLSKRASSSTWKAKNGTSTSSGGAITHSSKVLNKDDHFHSVASHGNHTSGKKVSGSGDGRSGANHKNYPSGTKASGVGSAWSGKGGHSVKAAQSGKSGASHSDHTRGGKATWAGRGWSYANARKFAWAARAWSGRGARSAGAKAAKSGRSSASHGNYTSGQQGVGPNQDAIVPPLRDRLIHRLGGGGQPPVSVAAPGSSHAGAVWVHASYPRCGSSTVLSMVEAAFSPVEQAKGKVFALFEPCHSSIDRVSKRLDRGGCKALLHEILNCNFREIDNLWGWSNPHSKHVGNQRYVQVGAERSCKMAHLHAFKTVWNAMRPEMEELLRNHTRLHVVDVVRDPRAIVTSWRKTPGMNLRGPEANGSQLMLGICRDFAETMSVKSDRVHRLVYEDLIRNPDREMSRLYKAVGFQYGAFQRGWIKKTFEMKDCKEGPYTDCHKNPEGHLTSWRSSLPAEEQANFTKDANCAKIAKAYGWPP